MSMPAVFVRVSLGHVGDSFEPIETISSSDLTLGILDIPKSRFGCSVQSVTAKIKNAEGATMNIPALLKGNVWTATFPRSHFARPGVSTLGVEIAIFGLDENGNGRDWIAGRGDLVVHDSEGGSVIPGEHFQNLHWYDEPPINPERGAVAPIDDVAKVWDGSKWVDFGGGGGAGGAVLTIVGSKVMNGAKEIATYAELLALVKSGGVVLLDTVAGQIAKSALFHPHMADSSAIRFDATGTLGDKVYTRSFAFTPKTGGGIAISRGDLTEIALQDDVASKVDRLMEIDDWPVILSNLLYCSHRDGEQNNQAILTSLIYQSPFPKRKYGSIFRMRLRGASNDSGVWDKRVHVIVAIGSSRYKSPLVDVPIGGYVDIELPGVYFGADSVESLHISFEREDGAIAKVRLGLVANAASDWILETAPQRQVTGFEPLIELYGVIERSVFVDKAQPVLANLAAVVPLATNASQAQILAKVNELISYMKEGRMIK